MFRRVRGALVRGAVVVPVACLSACESPTGSSSEADVVLTASPDPASAVPSTGVFYTVEGDGDEPDERREYDWKTSFTVSMAETKGVGLDITALSIRVQQATGGIITAPTTGEVERYTFNPSSSGNRLEGNGRASVAFDVYYDLPNLGREAVVTATFTYLDEKDQDDDFDDFQFTESVQVRVQ
jgi:hypothetical protein